LSSFKQINPLSGLAHYQVRDGKGAKDRVTMLPAVLVEPLKAHLGKVRALHQRDLEAGYGAVYLPYALARKYPRAAREWGWQYVFPSRKLSTDPRSGAIIWTRMSCNGPSRKRRVWRTCASQ